MAVTRHTRVTSEKVKDAALATVDYADDSITAAKILDHTLGSQNFSTVNVILQNAAQIKAALITEAKFSEHLEHGRLGSVEGSGTYIHFTTPFSAAPDVVISGIGTAARLSAAPGTVRAGVELVAGGTVAVHYIAWGAR